MDNGTINLNNQSNDKLSYLKKYQIFDNFNNPEYLKSLNRHQLKEISDNIRKFLIESLSKTGGHLSSNLGVVELTIALHYVFNFFKKDKIVFDVGHQTYVHKILTGRYKHFPTLRQKDGLSGFPDPEEHPTDLYKTGHVGTAIAMAAGFCINNISKNNNLKKHKKNSYNDRNIIAVIGDGSLTNGEMLESINFIANYKIKKMIIILNDNGMSISRTESAISKSLTRFSTGMKIRCYLNKLERKGLLPKKVNRILKRTITGIKSTFTANGLFEELGIPYVGPVNGHNLDELIEYLEFAKNYPETLILHVITKKGYGFSKAESDPEDFHSAKPFSIISGNFVKKSEKTFTQVFQDAISILGEKYKNVYALTAAMRVGCGLKKFQSLFPERFIDTGIAESFAVSLSGSLSKESKKAVCCIYSTFIQRAMDQIYHDIVLNKLPVLFCVDRFGLVGPDGPTHHGVYMQTFLQTLPNTFVVNPALEEEFLYFLEKGLNSDKTFFIQYPKTRAYSIKEIENEFFKIDEDAFVKTLPDLDNFNEKINKFKNNNHLIEYLSKLDDISGYKLSSGEEVAIIATGSLLIRTIKAKKLLLAKGINPAIYSFPIINPLKNNLLLDIIKNYNKLIILEESQFPSPIYSKTLEIYKDIKQSNSKFKKKEIIGFYLPKEFIPHAKRDEQLDMAGFSVDRIVNVVLS